MLPDKRNRGQDNKTITDGIATRAKRALQGHRDAVNLRARAPQQRTAQTTHDDERKTRKSSKRHSTVRTSLRFR